jgi:hypothetical protein
MSMVAKNGIRFASSVAFVGAAVACGSEGETGTFGRLGGDFGFVGSGGGGSGYAHDSGVGEGGGGTRDGGLDSGNVDDGSVGPGPEASSSANEGGNGNEAGAGSTVVGFDFAPGLFVSLDWVISGPSGYYSGTIYFGDAHSLEFVAGGIQAGTGYTITLAGIDRYDDPCSGTSAPFAVLPGEVSQAGVVLNCDQPLADASEPADVTTGAVGVEAGVILRDR